MHKIMLIRFSGSGKSTISKIISDILKFPVLYLDTVHWLPNRIENDKESECKIISDFLRDNNSWVIDRNYSHILLRVSIKFLKLEFIYSVIKKRYPI